MDTAHGEGRVVTLEEEIAAFRRQLIERHPDIAPSALQQEVGNYTARRKAELFCRTDT